MLKKSNGLLCSKPKIIYGFIESHPEYSAAKWVKLMNISRSGYCAWKKRKDDKAKKEKTYTDEIKKIFDESKGIYGFDRVCGNLENEVLQLPVSVLDQLWRSWD